MNENQDKLYAMRHSLAHIMATAIQDLWPEVKLGVGPVVENGFYYDIDLGPDTKLSEEDFPRIEEKMREVIADAQPFEQATKPLVVAKPWAEKNNKP